MLQDFLFIRMKKYRYVFFLATDLNPTDKKSSEFIAGADALRLSGPRGLICVSSFTCEGTAIQSDESTHSTVRAFHPARISFVLPFLFSSLLRRNKWNRVRFSMGKLVPVHFRSLLRHCSVFAKYPMHVWTVSVEGRRTQSNLEAISYPLNF